MHPRTLAALLATCLAACGGGPASGGPITLSVEVVDYMGAPVQGATVYLRGQPLRVATSGPDGRVAFPEVTPPYDLGIFEVDVVQEIRGLALSRVQLTWGASGSAAIPQATVEGRVTGPSFPLQPGEALYVAGRGGEVGAGEASPLDGSFHLSAIWTGSAVHTLELVAVLVRHGARPYAGVGLASRPVAVSLTTGSAAAGVLLPLELPVPTVTSTVRADFGAYAVSQLLCPNFTVQGADFFGCNPGRPTLAAGDSIVLPAGGATVVASGRDDPVRACDAWREVLVVPGETRVAFPGTVQTAIVAPAVGALGVRRAPRLEWTGPPGVTQTDVFLQGGGLWGVITSLGAATGLDVTDLGPLGGGLAAHTLYSWSVMSIVGASRPASAYAATGSFVTGP